MKSVTSPSDRKNCEDFSSCMHQFNNFIKLAELMDLPLQGRKCTLRNAFSSSQIDKGLINVQANASQPFMSLIALSRKLSNHNPILFLADLQVDQGLKQFKSLDYQGDRGSITTFLQEAQRDTSDVSIIAKLQCLRIKLKNWNREVFGDFNS